MAVESFDTVDGIKTDGRQARSFRGIFPKVIPFVVNLEEDSVADAASSMAAITVPGARLGKDFVLIAFGLDVADLEVSAQVTANDVVTVVVSNNTGGALTGLATASIARGVVLQTDDGIWSELD